MGALGKHSWILASAAALAWSATASADIVSAMIDISQYQDADTVTKIAKASNFELVMHRATLGADTVDLTYATSFRKIRNAKLSAGAYHVLYPQSGPNDVAHSGMNQAHAFLSTIAAACKSGEPVLLALDWESPSANGLLQAPASAQVATEFVSEVRSQTGADVLVYTDGRTLDATKSGIGQVLSKSPLWLAAYHRSLRFDSDPHTLKYTAGADSIEITIEHRLVEGLAFPVSSDYAPWGTVTFWQFSEGGDNGQGPGWAPIRLIEPSISPYDTSYFIGTRDAFRSFVANTSWKCDPKVAKQWANVAPPPVRTPPTPAPAPSPPPAPAAAPPPAPPASTPTP